MPEEPKKYWVGVVGAHGENIAVTDPRNSTELGQAIHDALQAQESEKPIKVAVENGRVVVDITQSLTFQLDIEEDDDIPDKVQECIVNNSIKFGKILTVVNFQDYGDQMLTEEEVAVKRAAGEEVVLQEPNPEPEPPS